MKNVFALVALAGIASVATAAPTLKIQVNDGSGWASSANVLAGTAVQVRLVVDWSDTTAYGFAGTLAKFVYSGVDGTDAIASSGANNLRVAPWSFGSAGTLRGSTSGSTLTVGLAGSGTTVGFLSFAQQPLVGSYSTANPAIIGSWSITVGAGRSLGSTLSIGALLSSAQGTGTGNPTGAFSFHSTSTSTSTDLRQDGSVAGALITVVPTPGTLALVGLGGLVAGRRRR